MIDKQELRQVVDRALEGTDLFVVEISVSGSGVIDIALDSDTDISIDQCVAVDRAVHAAFDTDTEDYELTVGSYGITSPLLLPRQFAKNIGNEAETLTADGRKLKGVITAADDDGFTLQVATRVKPEGKKRPETVPVDHRIAYHEAKQTKCIIKF